MKDQEMKNEIVKGWKEIAKYIGYSRRGTVDLEKKGLPIYRDLTHKKPSVFAYKSELEDFVTNYISSRSEREPKKGKKRLGWVSYLYGRRSRSTYFFVLLFGTVLSLWIAGYRNLQEIQEKRSRAISSIELTKSDRGIIKEIDLFDQNGQFVRELWKAPLVMTQSDSHGIFILSQRAIAFSPDSFGDPPYLIEGISGNHITLHTVEKVTRLDLPPIEITKHNGEINRDIYRYTSFSAISNDLYQGWVWTVNSHHDHWGCLVISDVDFGIQSTMVHPGSLFHVIPDGEFLFVAGFLNAREVERDTNRPIIFRLSLSRLLETDFSQLIPFSEKTIPTASRRENYIAEGIPGITADVYLGLPRQKGNMLLQKPRKGTIEWIIGDVPSRSITFRFDRDLEPFFSEPMSHLYEGPPDWKRKVAFQYWRDGRWSPWHQLSPQQGR